MVLKLANGLNLPLRQSYTFVLKGIYRDQRFRSHPKNRKKALKVDKRLRTIAGRPPRQNICIKQAMDRPDGFLLEFNEAVVRYRTAKQILAKCTDIA